MSIFTLVILHFKQFFGLSEKYVLISKTTGDQVIFDVINFVMETEYGRFQFHPDDATAINESYAMVTRL